MPTSDDASAGPGELGRALRALLRAGREMQTSMAHQVGIGETDLVAMDELVTSSVPLGTVELGNRLGIRSASATVIVDRLEAAGHVRREPHSTDRRRVVLQASTSAKDQVRATLTPLLAAITEIAGKLDPDENRTVMRFLHEITDAIQDFVAAAPSRQHGR